MNETLKTLIEKHGFVALCEELDTICREKADIIAPVGQNTIDAKTVAKIWKIRAASFAYEALMAKLV